MAIMMASLPQCIWARSFYTRSVGWPQGVKNLTHMGEAKTIPCMICDTARRVVYLPVKSPNQIFVHTKEIAMGPPQHKFWETEMQELYMVANA